MRSSLIRAGALALCFGLGLDPAGAADNARSSAQVLNAATANAALTVDLFQNESVAAINVTGLTAAGAVLTIEGSSDARNDADAAKVWVAINAVPLTSCLASPGATISSDSAFKIDTAGLTNFRVRVSSTGTGNVTIGYNAIPGAMFTNAACGGVVIVTPVSGTVFPVGAAGSTGLDYSANKPTLPNIGANFAASGPYASYVLIATAPASPTRNNIDIENTSGAQIAIVRDDGTAAGGAAPVNASVFALGGGSGAGAQGGAWSSQTFKGRIQVYAASSSAQVAVMVE